MVTKYLETCLHLPGADQVSLCRHTPDGQQAVDQPTRELLRDALNAAFDLVHSWALSKGTRGAEPCIRQSGEPLLLEFAINQRRLYVCTDLSRSMCCQCVAAKPMYGRRRCLSRMLICCRHPRSHVSVAEVRPPKPSDAAGERSGDTRRSSDAGAAADQDGHILSARPGSAAALRRHDSTALGEQTDADLSGSDMVEATDNRSGQMSPRSQLKANLQQKRKPARQLSHRQKAHTGNDETASQRCRPRCSGGQASSAAPDAALSSLKPPGRHKSAKDLHREPNAVPHGCAGSDMDSGAKAVSGHKRKHRPTHDRALLAGRCASVRHPRPRDLTFATGF